MDEMRYGTRTECKRRWTRRGRRPKCKVKLGYDWGYLYLALCPATGDLSACFCSHMDSDCFRFFTGQMGRELKEKGIGGKVVLIGDKATSHGDGNLPEGMEWIGLPTACPELNPAERFFQELRKELAQRVFANKGEVEACLSFWVRDYQSRPDDIVRLTNFKWMEYAV